MGNQSPPRARPDPSDRPERAAGGPPSSVENRESSLAHSQERSHLSPAAAIYHAKKWQASPVVRVVFGGLAMVVSTVTLVVVASPAAAIGPGGGAILWAETSNALPPALLAVALLRATATTAAVAAGGCGGVFVPFLAIGDISGRVFAPLLGVGNDLAGTAGAAGGIAGGYRLPITAATMALGIGGPRLATLTCLGTVVTASAAGAGAAMMVDRITKLPFLWSVPLPTSSHSAARAARRPHQRGV